MTRDVMGPAWRPGALRALWLTAFAPLGAHPVGSAFNIWYNLTHVRPLALSWDDRRDRLTVRLEGDHAVVRIPGELQKSKRDQTCATAPEFNEFLRETPADKRHGPVLELLTAGDGGELRPMTSANRVSPSGKTHNGV